MLYNELYEEDGKKTKYYIQLLHTLTAIHSGQNPKKTHWTVPSKDMFGTNTGYLADCLMSDIYDVGDTIEFETLSSTECCSHVRRCIVKDNTIVDELVFVLSKESM